MTDHLPECPAPLCDWGDPSAKCMGYEDCHHLCCCAALRACEQRVTQQWEEMRGWGETFAYKSGKDSGFESGLWSAREAIPHDEECLSHRDDADERDCNCGRPHALAAIDALREKP